MDKYHMQQQALHSRFKIKTHQELFHNYLEVVISPEGVVEYAVPSHQEKLISVLMEKNNWRRADVDNAIPIQYYCNMMEWLTEETGYIAVWNDMFYGIPNKEQTKMLQRLRAAGLYFGPCFPQKRNWFCVVTTVNSSGVVNADITDTVFQDKPPLNVSLSNGDKDVYAEWYPSLAAAEVAVEKAMKA